LQDIREYEVKHVLEFDSTRKKMSVILRCLRSNEILLLTKGAEDSIFSSCFVGDIQQCDNDIKSLGTLGYRTLAFAYRVLSDYELKEYEKLLLEAYNDINLRDEKLSKAFDSIESEMILIGATGIEDRLQEDCDKTLKALRKAGIKIWVLTGDKKETALNISQSCKHFSSDMILFNLTDYTTKVDFEERLEATINRYFKLNH
jgi:phospholipid-translocating ATPase